VSTTAKKSADKIDAILDGNAEETPWEAAARGVETAEVAPIDFADAVQAGEATALNASEQSAIVPIGENEVAASARVYSEFLDFDVEDMSIPRLRIASGQSQEVTDRKALPGQFLFPDAQAVDELEIVIIATNQFRRYQIEAPGGNRVELCKSHDARIGIGQPGGVCARCPLSQWGERNSVTGKSEQPPCSEGWSYQIYSLTHESMAVWDLIRTGIPAARKINMSLKMRKYRNFVVRVTSEQRTGPSGKYYVPVVETRPITREERQHVDAEVFV
jgi:hypothetical protein